MNERLWSPQMRKWAQDAHRHGIKIELERRGAGGGLGVLPLLGDAYATEDLTAFYGENVNVYYVPEAGTIVPASTISFGGAFPYNSNYPTHYINSDTWLSTWADDDKIYTTSADSTGWDGVGTWNLAISTLSSFNSSVRGTLVNQMTAFGGVSQIGSDGATYKPTGLISINGTLYLFATRQVYGSAGSGWLQSALTSQLVKSSDHGATWTPLPPSTAQPYVSPMFPSPTFAAPNFIQYGKDYQGNTVDNSSVYVYAISSTNWDNGSALYLGRVKVANIGNLNAADWSFWIGGDGMLDASWSSNLNNAVPILSSTYRLSVTAIQYFPGYGYLMLEWYYPNLPGPSQITNDSIWNSYLAPHPWGPWGPSTLIGTNEWNPQGYYNPAVIPKSVNGNSAVLAFTGDFNTPIPLGLYQLFLGQMYLNATPPTTAILDAVNIGNLSTLSSGNLTVNQHDTSNIYYVSARSTHSNSSGKFYCEFVYVTPLFFQGTQAIGLCNASFALTGTNDVGGNGLGRDLNSIGFYDAGGVEINNTTVHTIQTFTQSDVLQMAVDLTNKLIWFNVNNGNWNNSGAANPATGVGGFSLSTLNAGPYFAGISQWAYTSSNAMTVNFGAFGGYAYTPPSGFGNW